jgi:hypothetical protein
MFPAPEFPAGRCRKGVARQYGGYHDVCLGRHVLASDT